MGLLQKLTLGGGSLLSQANGGPITPNPLVASTSPLHNEYSITGVGAAVVNTAFQQYNDGVTNILPQPSQLDIGSVIPPSNKYTNNLPQ
jgi:hypothetical protein